MGKRKLTNEEKRRIIVEKLWLNYYNDTLLEKGVITEEQYRRMQREIAKKYANARW